MFIAILFSTSLLSIAYADTTGNTANTNNTAKYINNEGRKNMKRNLKKNVLPFILGILLGISVLPVAALPYSTATGSMGSYGPVSGYSYYNDSTISNWGTGNGINAKEMVATQNGSLAPTGYMGALCWLYKSGIIIRTANWKYNQEPDNLMLNITDSNYVSASDYYADGETRAYNGNGYTTYSGYQSPYLVYENN